MIQRKRWILFVLMSALAGIELTAQEMLTEIIPQARERNDRPVRAMHQAAHLDSLTSEILQQKKEIRQYLRDAMYLKTEE